MGEQTKPSMFASVPLNGGASTKLYDPASATEKIDWSLVSPNSARVVFTVAKSNDSNSPRNLYSVPLDGSTPPTKVNADLGTGERVDSAYITPDSSKIVYVVSKAEPGTTTTTTLYSAPLAGGTSTTLATNPTNLQLTSDSLRVVYAYKAQPTDQYQLYSVSIASAQPTRLDIPVNAEVSQYFKLSRDNQRVVFRTGEASAKSNLYSTMIDGSGTAIKINGAPSTDDRVKGFDISPDSSRVVYIADSGPFSADELYSVAITGGAVVKLNQAFDPAKGGYVEYPFQISPDSKICGVQNTHFGRIAQRSYQRQRASNQNQRATHSQRFYLGARNPDHI
jgi:hypothetical protein